MKKTSLIILAFVLLSGITQAQFYVRLGGGYGLPTAKETVGYDVVQFYDGNTSINTSESVAGSYGSGINLNLSGGYSFSKYLGVELGFNYLIGKTVKTRDYQKSYETVYYDTKTETKAKALFVTPTFVLTAGDGAYVPFAKFGVIAGMPTVAEEENHYDYYADATYITKWETDKKLTIGFQGAVGMNWTLNNNLKLVTELNFVSMKFTPDEKKVTSYTYNGQDIKDQLNEYGKRIIYKDKVDLYGEPSGDEPMKLERVHLPFSSVSFQVGIVYVFGGINVE